MGANVQHESLGSQAVSGRLVASPRVPRLHDGVQHAGLSDGSHVCAQCIRFTAQHRAHVLSVISRDLAKRGPDVLAVAKDEWQWQRSFFLECTQCGVDSSLRRVRAWLDHIGETLEVAV